MSSALLWPFQHKGQLNLSSGLRLGGVSAGWKVQVMPFIGLEKKSLMTSKYSTSKLVTEASVKYALQMISPHTHKINRALYQ
jgi:hypothetical protein